MVRSLAGADGAATLAGLFPCTGVGSAADGTNCSPLQTRCTAGGTADHPGLQKLPTNPTKTREDQRKCQKSQQHTTGEIKQETTGSGWQQQEQQQLQSTTLLVVDSWASTEKVR